MNLFKIETGIERQGSGVRGRGSALRLRSRPGVSPSASLRTGGRGSVVNCEAGFTLIEMIIVMVLMGILVAMAYSTLRTPNEKIACKEIYSNLQLAKLQAVSTGADVTVDVDADLNSVEDVDFPNEVNYLASAPANEPSGTGWTYQTGGIDFSAGDKTVTFTSKGMTADNGSVYLFDVDNPTKICAVAVLTTGLVKMAASSDGGASASSWN